MNEKTKFPGMIHRLSSIAALLCIVMMFVPAAEDSLSFREYHYWGEMMILCSRAQSGFYESESMWKVLALFMIVSALLLLLWAMQSFLHPENIGAIGLVASIANLIITACVLFLLLDGVVLRVITVIPILVFLMAIIALILAIKQKRDIKKTQA